MLINKRQVLFGGICSLLVLVIGTFTIAQMPDDTINLVLSLSLATLVKFYLAVFIIYAVTILLWSRYCAYSNLKRSTLEVVVDTGILAIGKYVPGKILGMIARGSIKSSSLVLSKYQIAVSFVEQICVLLVGFACAIFLYFTKNTHGIWILFWITILIVSAMIVVCLLYTSDAADE